MTSTPSPSPWSRDERDRDGHCRNAHGCHCRTIVDLASQLSEARAEVTAARETVGHQYDRMKAAEARLQQAVEGLRKITRIRPQRIGQTVFKTGPLAHFNAAKDIARTTIAAIQGDSL
jgi:hypothetical protein